MASGTFTVSAVAYPFEVLYESEGRAQEAEVSVRHIPGGNTSYVDRMGKTARRFSYGVYLSTSAAWDNLEGVTGSEGTLVTINDGTVTAVLLSLTRRTRWPGGETEGTAEFVQSA